MLLVNAVGSTQMHRLRVYLVFCVRQKVVKLQSPHTPLKPLHRIILNRIKEVGFPRRAETHRRHHSELILQLERYTRKRHNDDGGISLFSRKSLRLQTAEKYCCKCFVRSLAVVFGRVPEHTASEQTKRKEILRYRIATEAVIKPSTQKAFEQFLIFSLSLYLSCSLPLVIQDNMIFLYSKYVRQPAHGFGASPSRLNRTTEGVPEQVRCIAAIAATHNRSEYLYTFIRLVDKAAHWFICFRWR